MSNQTVISTTANRSRWVYLIESTRQRVSDLRLRREAWETTDYSRSNQTLYSLVADCLQLYLDLVTGDDIRAKKQGLNDFMNLSGVEVKPDAPLTLKLIRCVFGSGDRRRISSYHTALRVAVAAKWKPEEVPAQIAALGGIQELSLQRKGALTAKAKAESARAWALSQSVGQLSSEALKMQFDVSRVGELAAAVMSLNPDGTYDVHFTVHSSSAVTAALAAYFSSNKQAISRLQEEAALVAQHQQLDHLVAAAADAANQADLTQLA